MNFKLDKKIYSSKIKSVKTRDKILFHKYLTDLLNIQSDHKILDIGCGHGNTLMYVTEKLGKEGKAIGIDLDESLLAVAERLLSEKIKKGSLELVAGDVSKRFPFKKDYFDGIICHNVLECIPDKIAFINNCYDILKKGGTLILSHSDWDTQTYNSSFPELSRRLVHNYADTTQEWMVVSDGMIGRKLNGTLQKTKFTSYTPKIYVMTNYQFGPREYGYRIAQDIVRVAKRSGKFSHKEIKSWIDDLKEKSQNSGYYYSSNINLIVATK